MRKVFLLITTFCLGCSSCKDDITHDTIYIRNNDEFNIVFTPVLNKSEITCVTTPNKYEEGDWVIGAKNTAGNILKLSGDNWENKLKSNTLKVFFTKPDDFNKNSCATIKAKKLFVEKTITIDYLNQNNWTISYP